MTQKQQSSSLECQDSLDNQGFIHDNNLRKNVSWRNLMRKMVSVFLLIITMLTLYMATTSRWNSHPDEYAHFSAAKYYKSALLPPAPCEAENYGSYSSYGYSRLDKDEISYFLIGRFMQVLDVVPSLNDVIKARYFNVFMLFIIVLLSLKHWMASVLALPWLILPQIWYLYSYVNSEAFALFIGYIVFYQILVPSSGLRYYLKPEISLFNWRFIFLLIIGVSLFLIKKSFYFVPIFLFGTLCIAILFKQFSWRRNFIKGLWLLLLSLSVVFSLKHYHQWVADFKLSEKITECHYITADAPYLQNRELARTPVSMFLQEKGMPLSYVFDQGWAQSVWMSTVGFYGYFQYKAEQSYYHVMLALFALLMLIIFSSYVIKASWYDFFILSAAITMFLAIAFVGIWLSWTYDYQAQGRYFFALVPILGYLVARKIDIMPIKMIAIIVFLMFLIGLYSFIFVGIGNIPKIV